MKKAFMLFVCLLFGLTTFVAQAASDRDDFYLQSGGGGEDVNWNSPRTNEDCSYSGYNCSLSYEKINNVPTGNYGCLCQKRNSNNYCWTQFKLINPSNGTGFACVTENQNKYCVGSGTVGAFSSYERQCSGYCFSSWKYTRNRKIELQLLFKNILSQ